MRRLGFRILIGIGIAAILAVAAIVTIALVRFTAGSKELAREVAALANMNLFDKDSTRVRIADLSGNPFTRLDLHKVEVEVWRDGAWTPFLTVERIETGYRLDEVGRGRRKLRTLRLIEPRVTMKRGGPLPRLKLRQGDGVKLPGEESGGFVLAVDRLLIERAQVTLDTLEVALGLAGRLEFKEGHASIGVDSLAVNAGDYPGLRLKGSVQVRGDLVELEDLSLESGQSRVVIDGTLEGTRGAHLRIDLDRVDLADAQAAASARLFGGEGWVRGTAEIDGAWKDLEIKAALDALVGEDHIDSLRAQGRVIGDVVEIEDVALTLNGVPFRGTGLVGLGRRQRESRGRLEFESVDLRDFPVLRDQPWMPAGKLSGVLTIGVEARGPAGRERPFDLVVSHGVVRGFILDPGHFRGAVAPDGRIRLDEYEMTTRGAVIAGAGEIDPRGEFLLAQELDIADLAALGGMFGERRFGGQGRLVLRLAGPVRAPTFDGEGTFDSLGVGAVHLAGADVQLTRGTFRPAFGFTFEATSAGGTLAGRSLDTLAVAGSYVGGKPPGRKLTIAHLTAGRGETSASAGGTVSFSQDGIVLDLTALEAAARKEHWESAGTVRVTRYGNVWTIDGLNLIGSLGALSLSGKVEPGGPATALEAHLVDVDLATLGALLGREGFAGKVELSLKAVGGGATSQLEFHAIADSLRIRSFAAAHLEIIGSVHGETITISRLVLDRGGKVEVAGDVRFQHPIGGFGGLARLADRATWRGAVVDLGVRAPALDMAAWHGIHPHLDRLSGLVDLTAAFTGRPSAPDGSITLRAEKLMVGAEELGQVAAQGRLQEGLLLLDDLRLTLAGSPLAVRGTTPIRLSLIRPPALDRDQTVGLAVDLAGSSLAVARLVTDRVGDAAGPVSGSVELAGTLRAPLVRGAVSVNGGWLRLRGREEVLTDLSGQLEFAGDQAVFTNVVASDGDKGQMTASGTLKLLDGRLGGYDATFELRRFAVRVTGEYAAVLDGTFHVERGVGGLPEYTGTVLVHRLDYLREVSGGEEEGDEGPSSWVGRFDVDLPGNAWIRNTDLEVELRGQVVYERGVSGRAILGRLETVRGRYTLFGHTFRITSGEILFTDPGKIDPELNVSAETRIPEARIFATVTGRASDRQVVLTSDPDYDQASLWKMLVPSGAGGVTSLVGMTPFVSDLEQTIFREIPGLSVSIEERVTDESGATPILGVRAGTYVGSDVFFSAYQGFSGPEQDVSIEYDLPGRLWFLKGSAVRRGVTEGNSQDIEQEYNLDLNLRWEF